MQPKKDMRLGARRFDILDAFAYVCEADVDRLSHVSCLGEKCLHPNSKIQILKIPL